MMKFGVLLMAVAISGVCIGQKELKEAEWDVSTSKEIQGTSIMRLEGVNDGVITNVGYQSLAQLETTLKEQAKHEEWSKEKLKQKLEVYRTSSEGGMMQLYVTRNSKGAANLKHYTMMIKDMEENTLHTKTLKDRDGKQLKGTTQFKNKGFTWINSDVKPPFYIYVVDESGTSKNSYKFEIGGHQ